MMYKFMAIMMIGMIGLSSCQSEPVLEDSGEPRRILFLGDSLTEGKGVQSTEAYPNLIQNKINEAGYNFVVENAGISGHTSGDGLRRLDPLLQNEVHIFVLALGANDGLQKRGAKQMEENLNTIFTKVKQKYPDVQLVMAGVDMGLVYGLFFTKEFKATFKKVAEAHDATFIPSILKGVVGKQQYNTGDGIHPNPAGHQIMAETVWEELEDLL